MPRAIRIALIALVLLPAGARASDQSTSETYLRANYALVKVGHANLGATVRAYKSVLSTVKRDCPRAAAGSPQNPESTQLSNELIGTMVLSAGKPDRPAIAAYLKAVAHLRWSSAKVTREVASYAAMLRKLYALQVPDLCGDVKAWTATGFKTLSASTVSFVGVFYPNWVALGLVPPGIASFESTGARTLAHESERLEYDITNVEAQAVNTWWDTMNELEVNP